MRLFAALGPGDIVANHKARDTIVHSDISIPYSEQLLEYCRLRGITLMAISYNSRADSLRDGLLQIENRPRLFEKHSGIRFHVSELAYACYLALRARRFGAEFAIINAGTAHYFALVIFWLLRIPVAINFHGTLWPNGFKPRRAQDRLLMALHAIYFRFIPVAASGVSPECGIQLRELTRGAIPFFEYRAQFKVQGFPQFTRDHKARPFRVIFVGRAEKYKGVLDIVSIAERLRDAGEQQIAFDIVGGGDALDELKQVVRSKGLDESICIHGQLARPALLKVYEQAHAVIVPTRSTFAEGLPKVCAEAALSGLPIITSRLSNALPVLGPAIFEVEPDNIDSYVKAVSTLAHCSEPYYRLSRSCSELTQPFLDRSRSLPAAVDRILNSQFPGWQKMDDYGAIFERLGAGQQNS